MTRRRQTSHVSHERWLVSYADFITLMFAFFVVLYASSQADRRKQAEVSASIHQAFQPLGLFQAAALTPHANATGFATSHSTVPTSVVLRDHLVASPAVREDMERIERELEGKLANQIAQHVIAMHIGREGLLISLREAGFYDRGSAIPHPSSMKSLDAIASSLESVPYDIRIEGHTDNMPIHTARFDSNWELSSTRATHLAELFIEQHQFLPQRLSASGYAEYHPVASNATAEGRSQNCRVDIIVLPKISGDSEIDLKTPDLHMTPPAHNALGHRTDR
jgi:chemotaxis protein MotB